MSLHKGKKKDIHFRRYFAILVLILTAAAGCLAAVRFFSRRNNYITTASGRVINLADYPESLIEFMDKYPETQDFVLEYPTYKDEQTDMDISGDIAEGGFPLFLQWDRRWGYQTYGDDFLAVTGCGPTSLSMVYTGLTRNVDWNPYQVAKMAEQSGYYVDGVGSSWDLMTEGAAKLGLKSRVTGTEEDLITDALKSGEPVICSVGPGDFTTSGHFIVLSGIDSDGKISVLDPNSRVNSEKTWDMDTLFPQIVGSWAYRYDAGES